MIDVYSLARKATEAMLEQFQSTPAIADGRTPRMDDIPQDVLVSIHARHR